jgi:ankyrin repeat protein
VVRLLLQYEASTNVVDAKGSSPLHLAAWAGHGDIVRLILSQGPSVPKVNLVVSEIPPYRSRGTPVTGVNARIARIARDPASRHWHRSRVRRTLRRILVPRFAGIHHFGFGDAAAWRTSLVKKKKKKKKEKGKKKEKKSKYRFWLQTKDNETALHHAAQYGYTEVVAQLLQYGCDPSIRNSRGESALDLAAQYGR